MAIIESLQRQGVGTDRLCLDLRQVRRGAAAVLYDMESAQRALELRS